MRGGGLAVVAVIAVLGLAGCSSPASPKVLAREATAEDQLPESVSLGGVDMDITAGTARLLATHEDVKYFAAKSSTGGSACLIVVPVGVPEQWVAGCAAASTGEEIVTLTGVDGSMTKLINDRVDASQPKYQGWTKIHENVLVGSR
ncbi:hypothetical protein SAMN04487917_10757 [Arthrobacter sp. yr096]|uniref:hypothetical protein n=1 Tax=unclassified Arthrobacter TaxID=235627 RepID=UPI000896B7FE|nr:MULTISPECIES: hypothetical protein [unclassified Arthrobacter]SDX24610.1 hypothetical protein SAMN04487912_10958 [Arthrobacter sp. cf158]SEJ55852.1 hypothetical protein SAMN04487917_10757 [Arthrobacter sp. yr096]